MDVDVKDVKDEYKDVKYVIYSDLDKYAGSRYTGKFYGPTLYKGKIEYYDANDKLIKTVDDAEEIVCINDYDIEGLKVTDDGYLINPFGMVVTEEGFYNFDGVYYYVSGIDSKVLTSSIATNSDADYLSDNLNGKVIKNNIIYDENEEPIRNSICRIKRKIYLTDINGSIVSDKGVHRVDNIYDATFHLVYIDINGKVKKNKYKDYYCYVGDNGEVLVNTFIEDNGKTYFANDEGRLLRNEYLSKDFFFDMDCVLKGNQGEKTLSKKKYVYDVMTNNKHEGENSNKYVFKYKNGKEETVPSLSFDKDLYVYDKDGNLMKNSYIVYAKSIRYTDETGMIVKDAVMNIDGKDYIFSRGGEMLQDVWIFDREYYSNKKLKSKYNPYVRKYRLSRELSDKYNGYYVMPSGEILYDDVYVETANIKKDKIELKWTAKNKEYNGEYDEDVLKLGTYDRTYKEYVYEEVNEGEYEYVHKFKTTNNGYLKEIDNGSIDDQIHYRFELTDMKISAKSDIVYMGKYPYNDMTGEVFEEIPWVIYKKEYGEAFLVSAYAIDVKEFDKNNSGRWDESSLRKWLNNDFIDMAFDDNEKSIETTYCTEKIRTDDKVFLISREEARDLNDKHYYFYYSNYAKRENPEYTDNIMGSLLAKFIFRSATPHDRLITKTDKVDGSGGGPNVYMDIYNNSFKATDKGGIVVGMWVRYE